MHERKRTRLKGYDYRTTGAYFVTTNVKNWIPFFGEIKNNKMILNQYGKIVYKCWFDLPNHYDNCVLDEFIVMPDHIHGIIFIRPNIINYSKHSLSEIMRALKTFSSRRINEIYNGKPFKWQRSFYDRIIRNDIELYRIRNYIKNNPTAAHPP